MHVIIPMAGLGTRLKDYSDEPKPLIEVGGKTLIEHSLDTLRVQGNYTFVIRGDQPYSEYLEKELDAIANSRKRDFINTYNIVRVNENTSGAAETCLHAWEDDIEADRPLIITNCDQHLANGWFPEEFLDLVGGNTITDGAVVTYTSTNPKNSFAETNDQGDIIRIVEKDAISDRALVGIHYWRRAADFYDSATELIDARRKAQSDRETYISETYQMLIDRGKSIEEYPISDNCYFSLGTPEDIAVFSGCVGEYKTVKPKTLFIDLDGTIFRHSHQYSNLSWFVGDNYLLPGARARLDEWDSIGHTIVLVTARKESAREVTEAALQHHMIPYDQLIMGVTSGERVLINDKINEYSPDRAVAHNVITDSGLEDVEV